MKRNSLNVLGVCAQRRAAPRRSFRGERGPGPMFVRGPVPPAHSPKAPPAGPAVGLLGPGSVMYVFYFPSSRTLVPVPVPVPVPVRACVRVRAAGYHAVKVGGEGRTRVEKLPPYQLPLERDGRLRVPPARRCLKNLVQLQVEGSW
jgi:hypothetical protein